MKKIRLLIIGLIAFIPIGVNAAVSLSCPSSVGSGKNFTCNIYSGAGSFTSVAASLDLPNGFNYTGNKTGTVYTSVGSGSSLSFKGNGSFSDVIATLNITAPNVNANTNYTLSLKNFVIVASDGKTKVPQSDVSTTLKITSTTTAPTTPPPTVGTSKSFTVTFDANGGTGANDPLTCETTSSSCNINLSSLKVPTRSGYSFTGWGSKNSCTTGNKVTYSASKNTTLYACWTPNSGTTSGTTTTTTKPADTDTKLYLKSLEIENQTIEFSKFKFEYEFKVLYEVESLNITAIAAKDGVTVKYDNPASIVVGENTISIVLTDEEAHATTYTLKVTRLKEGEVIKEESSDATLSSINLGDYSISFSPTVTNYDLTIGYKTNAITATCTTNDPNATCVITGNLDLATGSIIKVDVKAEDGTINTYKINITKQTFLETYMTYIIIIGVVILALLVFFIISSKNKKKKPVPKTTVVKKVPIVKQTVKPSSDPKSNVEVLKM